MTLNIVENLHATQKHIEIACQQHQRATNTVALLAVSKSVNAQRVYEAIQAGQLAFGENYVQESIEKIRKISHILDKQTTLPRPKWHFIGSIQSNKTTPIAEHFDWVHTIDRYKIAKRLSDQRPNNLPPLQVCIQVNTDAAPSKSGISPEQALELAHAIKDLPNITLRGLMHIPEPSQDNADMQQKHLQLKALFATIKKALNLPQFDTLSMGMSNDIAPAIAAGSTIVRVGTNIFGARTTRP